MRHAGIRVHSRSFAAILVTFAALAQDPEQQALQQALAEAGSSDVDFIRALETHLRKFPKTGQRQEIEKALVRKAMDLRDQKRVIEYGERVLAYEPVNVELLERVTRYLLAVDDKERSVRALGYAKRLEETARALAPSPGTRSAARLTEEQQLVLGKAFIYQSRAAGNLGKLEDGEALARKAWDIYPSAEAAREAARWLDRQNKSAEAIERLADAFAIADPASDASDRARDRARLGEWYRKLKGSESGLGDLVLAAYDRTQKRIEDHRAAIRKIDPNAEIADPSQFTLSGLAGDKLSLGSLKGKVVVLDFWATWCGPCRAQLPLYEEVMKKFKGDSNVVFLNINTDENKDLVKPFLERNKWNKTVYFEDGLSALLRVSSIPTTIVINPRGEVTARMNGYIPERFVEMLTGRINQSLEEK